MIVPLIFSLPGFFGGLYLEQGPLQKTFIEAGYHHVQFASVYINFIPKVPNFIVEKEPVYFWHVIKWPMRISYYFKSNLFRLGYKITPRVSQIDLYMGPLDLCFDFRRF